MEVGDVPMVHACARRDCDVLTMGRFCLEHEQEARPPEHSAPGRVTAAIVLFAVGIVGAALRARLWR